MVSQRNRMILFVHSKANTRGSVVETFERLLLQNKAWAEHKVSADRHFFGRLSEVQTPDVLWFGCSDSRVPPEIAVNAQPGGIFVHRHIANQVITTDFNSLSVLQYAVDVLKVKQVIVGDHHHCGGIRASLKRQNPGLLMVTKWLKHIDGVIKELTTLGPGCEVPPIYQYDHVA